MRRRRGIEVVVFLHRVREVKVVERPRRGRRATIIRWPRQGVEIVLSFFDAVVYVNWLGRGVDVN